MKLDNEKASKNLKVILEKALNDADLELLGEYRKLFKKEVSLFRRSWISAWLLMYYDKKEFPNIRSVTEKKPFVKETPSPSPSDVEVNLSEEESTRLFFSIGKNRHLFPREVIIFICSKTTVPREDIGVIKILDNYSFVQVRDTRASEIIEALNGLKFKGRTLTVNYAKPKIADTGNSEEN
ncbi:DbpA RNA binding domain-containing protein [Treponema sp. R6D11]